mgnify:CR=1 FL=1
MFARHRTTYDIVVYTGRFADFTPANIPTDETWARAKYFPSDDAYGAARFIVAFLEVRG